MEGAALSAPAAREGFDRAKPSISKERSFMNDDMDRDTPAHFPAAAYGFRSIIIFVTVCAKDRKSIFANEAAHALIVDAWRRANGWFVGRYVVMPDHVHFFCSPGMDEPPALKQWVRYWKTTVSRRWGSSSEQPIW